MSETHADIVDRLATLDGEIKRLEVQRDNLKQKVIAIVETRAGDDNKVRGSQLVASVIISARSTLDQKALVATHGQDFIAPFMRTSVVKSVRLGTA